MFIQTESTPNPGVLKFLPGRDVLGDGTREFQDVEEGAASPLARDLFALSGVTRVFFGADFLTVRKDDEHDWSHLKAPILAAIMDHYTSGAPIMAGEEAARDDERVYDADAQAIIVEIKDLLDTRIRPAVAQDGGDILFSHYEPENGTVWLHMRGACAGCPSSAATLKSGVENMLRHYVPEVARVEQAL